VKIETDIKVIARLSQQREDTNWAFRSFLKGSGLSVAKLDSRVHGLYKEVSSQIDCTKCGNCCKVIQPNLSATDIKRLARLFESTTAEFRSRFVKENESGEGFSFYDKPCPFLNNNRCTVYGNRPRDCRSFPHLHKKEFVTRLFQAVYNCAICPIVFNVYEGLKETHWPTRFKWPKKV
jgi:uncharacterized protein